jgi:uncharacterized membrane protein (DUF485 family)
VTDVTDDRSKLQDPAFRRLLAARSRWRWGLSISLVGSYLLYVLAGLYVPALYAAPFAGTAIPWGVVLGYLIILMSIVMSVVYVRAVGKLVATHVASAGRGE